MPVRIGSRRGCVKYLISAGSSPRETMDGGQPPLQTPSSPLSRHLLDLAQPPTSSMTGGYNYVDLISGQLYSLLFSLSLFLSTSIYFPLLVYILLLQQNLAYALRVYMFLALLVSRAVLSPSNSTIQSLPLTCLLLFLPSSFIFLRSIMFSHWFLRSFRHGTFLINAIVS